MKSLKEVINESMRINEALPAETNFINFINKIIDNTDSLTTFNNYCEELYNILAQYEDVEINNTSPTDLEKGAVYCYLSPVADHDPVKKDYGQKYHLQIEFGLTGGGIGFSSRPIPSFVENKHILCGTGKGDGINLFDFKTSLTPKDVIKDSAILKKSGKSTNIKRFLKDLRKSATKW